MRDPVIFHEESSLSNTARNESTLLDVLRRAATVYPSLGVTLCDEKVFISYADLWRDGNALACGLRMKNIERGAPLMITVDDSRSFLVALWGGIIAGNVVVPVPPAPEGSRADFDIKRLRSIWATLEHNAAALGRAWLVCGTAGQARLLREKMPETVPLLVSGLTEHGFHQDADAFARREDLAVIQFSSGSTGEPKGVLLTHGHIASNLRMLEQAFAVDENARLLSWFPYYHDFGLFGSHLLPAATGAGELRISPEEFASATRKYIHLLEAHRATHTYLTPSGANLLLRALSRLEQRDCRPDLSSLRRLILGAEMLPAATCDALRERLAPCGLSPEAICPGYGLAEACLGVSVHQPARGAGRVWSVSRHALLETGEAVPVREACRGAVPAQPGDRSDVLRLSGAGLPMPGMRWRVVDEEGAVLPAMRVGQLQLRSPCLTGGYCMRHELDYPLWDNGWLQTGDMGFLAPDNEFVPVGRKKELIVTNGRNVYPYDLEEAARLSAGSRVRTVIAAGSLDPETGRDVALLFIVFAKNTAAPGQEELERMQRRTAAAIRERLNQECGVAVEHIFRIRQSEIPMTSSGKTTRHELVRRYMQGAYSQKEIDMRDPIAASIQEESTGLGEQNLRGMLRAAWASVLEKIDLQPQDNASFFSFGADSMRAAQLAALVESSTGQKLPANFAYRYPTLKEQLQALGGSKSVTRPATDLEVLVRDVLADVVGRDPDSLGVDVPFMQLCPAMDVIVRFAEELRCVFGANEHVEAALAAGSIRAMAQRLEALAPGKNDPIPLMPFQETLYFHSRGGMRNEPTGLSCYIMVRLPMSGELNVPVLEQALNELVERHPLMRAALDDSNLAPCLRLVNDMEPVRVVEEDITHLAPEAIVAQVRDTEMEMLDLRWDLRKPPLFTVRLLRTGRSNWELFFHADHMIMDGYSAVALFKELFSVYDGRIDGREGQVVYELHPFAWHSWIASCRERTSRYKRDMEWQLEDFTPPPPRSAMPMKRNPAMVEKVTFNSYHHPTHPDLLTGLRELSSSNPELSVNSVLLAGLFKLVNVWTAENDLVINLPLLNREQFLPTSRDVVGSFIDLIPIRLRTSFSEPILSMAGRLEKIVREKLERPVSSIGLSREIARRSGLHGSMSSIIFSNSLSLMRPEDLTRNRCDIWQMPAMHTGAPGTSIDVLFHSSGEEWRIVWNYMRDLFDESFIVTLAQQYDAMLRDALEAWRSGDPARTFTSAAALPPEHARLLEEVNDTARDIRVLPLHEFMRKHASRAPEAIALTFKDRTVTYGQFDAMTSQLAALFSDCGTGRGDFVALALPRGTDLVLSQFAAFKAGAAYVPIDPAYPGDRIAYMIDDSQARVLVITPEAMKNLSGEKLTSVRHILVLDENALPEAIDNEIQNHIRQAGHNLLLRKNIEAYDRAFSLKGERAPRSDDPAYMIYTSGSTGKPKGVIVSHANFCNFIDYVLTTFARGPEERFALVTSHSFDMTLASNLGSLMSGASLHILSEDDTRDVEKLLSFLEEKQISLLNITPSHFSMLTSVLPLVQRRPKLFGQMRVLLGGEVVNPADVTQWVSAYPEHKVVNEYGPTEASVAVSFFPIPTENGVCRLDVIPIGKPMQNTRYYILNEEMQPCMLGVPGRLFIGGANVARGYWRKKDKTEQAFVADIFARAEGRPDAMMYDTGDMARWLEDGNVQFLGRNDRQVNLRGFRIELGEIENVMLSVPGINGASVAVQEDHGGQRHLAAFYTAGEGTRQACVAPENMRRALEAMLPEYMVPRFYMQLERMPLTPSGKLDVKQLPYIVTSERPTGTTLFVAPATRTEKRMAAIWSEVFNLDAVGVDDDFWSLGGNSIRATRLLVSMHEAGIRLGLRDLFANPTVRQLSATFDEANRPVGAADPDQEPAAEAGWVTLKNAVEARTTLLCLPYAGGSPAMFAEFAAKLPLDMTIQSALYPGIEGGTPCGVVKTLARELKSRLAVKGRVILFGYCFGAYVAHALAKLLRRESAVEVCSVILTGATPPGAQKLAYDPQKWSAHFEDPQSRKHLEKIYEPLLRHLSRQERTRYWACYKAAVAGSATYVFGDSSVDVPCHVLTGEQEEYPFLLEYAHTWEQQFPGCSQYKVPGGHMMVQTNLEDLLAVVTPILGEAC